MIPELLIIATLAACPLTARITTQTYGHDVATTTCTNAFQFQKGIVKITVLGDGIFKNGFERTQ